LAADCAAELGGDRCLPAVRRVAAGDLLDDEPGGLGAGGGAGLAPWLDAVADVP
jgi:hypothetical protein